MTPAETTALLAELARIKALFQLRAIAAHMGIPAMCPPRDEGEGA